LYERRHELGNAVDQDRPEASYTTASGNVVIAIDDGAVLERHRGRVDPIAPRRPTERALQRRTEKSVRRLGLRRRIARPNGISLVSSCSPDIV